MNILEVSEVTSFIVKTDNDCWPIYRRNGPDNWENLMGESWEGIYDTDDLEVAFLAYNKNCS